MVLRCGIAVNRLVIFFLFVPVTTFFLFCFLFFFPSIPYPEHVIHNYTRLQAIVEIAQCNKELSGLHGIGLVASKFYAPYIYTC